jgi:peptidyl-prolyl cis-trans isomerase B (cyclophilin B)
VANQKKPGTGATNKRRKALAGAKLERQQARRQAKAAQRRRRRTIAWSVVGLVVVLAVVGWLVWPFGGSSNDVAAPPAASPTPSASPVDIGCDPAPTPPATPQTSDKAPATVVDPKTAYTLTLKTNCGDIAIKTLTAKAPKTVNAILSLADAGYYDDTLCHRLTTSGIFVLQCGDPTATGSGGPGFTIPDENLPKAGDNNYPKGTVAMANSGADTAGSQFFIVYKDTTLPAGYTTWGTVTKGLDVVEKVAKAGVSGDATDGQPAAPIGILSTTVTPALADG